MPLGLDVYSSRLVAADRLPAEIVERITGAVLATLERQRHDPDRGLAEVVARCLESSPTTLARAGGSWSPASSPVSGQAR